MKRPTFFNGAIVAGAFAFIASTVIAALTPFFGFIAVIRIVIPALSFAYILYLFSRSRERTGRVTTLALWSALAAITWWVAPPLPAYLLVHVGAIWLVRSLYFYSGLVPALADLALGALAVIAAVWAMRQSGSIFLATWCFFLVQALFVAIPPTVKGKPRMSQNTAADNETFERARRQADQALTQLFSQ